MDGNCHRRNVSQMKDDVDSGRLKVRQEQQGSDNIRKKKEE
jgi:hypothetical protein